MMITFPSVTHEYDSIIIIPCPVVYSIKQRLDYYLAVVIDINVNMTVKTGVNTNYVPP